MVKVNLISERSRRYTAAWLDFSMWLASANRMLKDILEPGPEGTR